MTVMKEVKVNEVSGAALDWLVAKVKGNKHGQVTFNPETKRVYETEGLMMIGVNWSPSTNWAQGGPIIERELIDIQAKFNSWTSIVPKGQWYWQASTINEDDCAYWFDGPTALIASMRCYVASKLGEVVEIPEELK